MRVSSLLRGRFAPLWLLLLFAILPLLALAADDEKSAKEDDDDKPRERPAAEEAAEVVIHEWNFWVADPTTERINAADLYPASLPAQVETIRSRKMPQGMVLPSPLAMMTFTGKPVSDIEIDLRISAGRVLAHWPPGKYKNSRLRWLDYSLGESLDDAPQLVPTPLDHWFNQARKEGLYLRSKARSERFLTYDVELNFNTNIKLAGGPDKYTITNPGPHPLSDVLISAPTKDGRRIGWLDALPVSKAAGQSAPTPTPSPAPQPTTGTAPTTGTVPAPDPVPAAPKAAEEAARAANAAAEAAKKAVVEKEAQAAAEKDAERKKQAVEKEAAAAKETQTVKQDATKPAAAAEKPATGTPTAATKTEAATEKADTKSPAPANPPMAETPVAEVKPAAAPGKLVPAATSPAPIAPSAKPGEAKPADAKPAESKAAELPGVEIVMSAPLKPGSDEYKAQTVDSLRARLVKAGLTESEADLMLAIYAQSIFESEDLVVIYRVPQALIDEKLPLAVYPDAKKIVRVGLVLVRNVDPQISSDIQQLVAQLGDAKYQVREKAAKRLSALGPLASPALKEAAKSTDAEVQFRAERILQEQEPDENGQPRNRARAVRVLRAG
jgi:hypothetical protein